MTEVSWITFRQGFHGLGHDPGDPADPGSAHGYDGQGSTNALAIAPAFHDPTAPPMNCREAVGQGVQDTP